MATVEIDVRRTRVGVMKESKDLIDHLGLGGRVEEEVWFVCLVHEVIESCSVARTCQERGQGEHRSDWMGIAKARHGRRTHEAKVGIDILKRVAKEREREGQLER